MYFNGVSLFTQGYYRRAEAARRLFRSTERDVVQRLFPLINFEEALTDAVRDYCRSHQLQENVTAMSHAIVLAVDNGKLHVYAIYNGCKVNYSYKYHICKYVHTVVYSRNMPPSVLKFVLRYTPGISIP